MRWVLYDANGTYLVGNFDGKTFHPEDLDWKDKKVVMDQGPDFYAAQHFYRTDPLKEPVIQITWMDHWNGPLGLSKALVEKAILETLGVKKGINQTLLSREDALKLPIPFEAGWERNATIPVTVELVTYRGKPTLSRNPVESLKTLYTDTRKWRSELLPADGSKNLLSGIQSKTCDMTAVFDLKNVSTGEIVFHLNGRDIRYDIARHKLIGKQFVKSKSDGVFIDTDIQLLPLENGLLTIRILLDWSSVEIFGNDGLFAYTEHYAFDPKNRDVGIIAKGADVPLISLEFNEVGSIWKSFQGK
jgi:levanase/fructan beta-fructosidase